MKSIATKGKLLRFPEHRLQTAAVRIAYKQQRQRLSDLIFFEAFLSDMETIAIREGLHNKPGAYELLETANLKLGASLADCCNQLAVLQEQGGAN